jgi:hypothetical protein
VPEVEVTIKHLNEVIGAKFDLVFLQLEGIRKDVLELQSALKVCRLKSDATMDSLTHEMAALKAEASFDRGQKSARTEWHTVLWAAITALATAGIVFLTVITHQGGKP